MERYFTADEDWDYDIYEFVTLDGSKHVLYFRGYRDPEASNQAMQRTAGRAAFPLLMTSAFNPQSHALSPAVADLGSR